MTPASPVCPLPVSVPPLCIPTIGFGGFMYDYGEYVSPNAVAFDGTKGEELHNAYPVQYQKVAYDFFMSKVRTRGLSMRIHVRMCT